MLRLARWLHFSLGAQMLQQPSTRPDGPFGAGCLFPPCLPISWPSLLCSTVDPVISFLEGQGGGLAQEA